MTGLLRRELSACFWNMNFDACGTKHADVNVAAHAYAHNMVHMELLVKSPHEEAQNRKLGHLC
jgi:hypothetical protein